MEYGIIHATITIFVLVRRSIGVTTLLLASLDPVAAMATNSGNVPSVADVCNFEELDGPAGRNPAVLVSLMQCLELRNRHGAVAVVARRLLALEVHVELAREALARALAQGFSDVPAHARFDRGGRFGFELGYDSNINRGALADTISIPLLDNRLVPLDPLLQQKSSIFLGTQLGGWVVGRLTGGWFGSLQGDIDARLNPSEHIYLPHNRRVALQIGRRMGAMDAVVTAASHAQNIGKHLIVDGSHVSAAMQWVFLPQTRLSASVDSSRNRYPHYADLTLHGTNWGIGLEHLPDGIQAAFMQGAERSGTADLSLDRNYSGIGVAWRRRIGDGKAVATANWFRTRYAQPSALFGLTREEDWLQVVLAYETPMGNNWTLIPRMILEKNDANLEATSYRRRIISFEIRKDF